MSMPLYVLTFLLSFLCAIYTWRYVPPPGRTKAFLALMLLLETGMAGTFIAFDLILFFVFWELVLVPMYFLIGIWGRRTASTPRSSSSCSRCSGRSSCCWASSAMYFAGPDAAHVRHAPAPGVRARAGSATTSSWSCSAAIALGLAVKVPMWPFHTWLPDAHTEAPDDRLRAAGRGDAEDGDVRVHPHRDPDCCRRARRRTRRGSGCSRRSRSSTPRSRVSRRRT